MRLRGEPLPPDRYATVRRLAELGRAYHRCEDPEGEWIREQEREAGGARGEHEAEGRAVEAHQEAKHGDW